MGDFHMIKEISVSYLLSEEETVEAFGIFSRLFRQKKISFFFIVTGLCCVIAALADIALEGKLTGVNVIFLLFGIVFAFYYDGFVLKLGAKQGAKRQYDLQENKKLSYAFELNDTQISLKNGRYMMTAKPEQMWKCVETKLLFYIYINSETGFSVPKRVLTQQEISEIRQVFEQALPKSQFVKYGR